MYLLTVRNLLHLHFRGRVSVKPKKRKEVFDRAMPSIRAASRHQARFKCDETIRDQVHFFSFLAISTQTRGLFVNGRR
jgi:hypothetical protein